VGAWLVGRERGARVRLAQSMLLVALVSAAHDGAFNLMRAVLWIRERMS